MGLAKKVARHQTAGVENMDAGIIGETRRDPFDEACRCFVLLFREIGEGAHQRGFGVVFFDCEGLLGRDGTEFPLREVMPRPRQFKRGCGGVRRASSGALQQRRRAIELARLAVPAPSRYSASPRSGTRSMAR